MLSREIFGEVQAEETQTHSAAAFAGVRCPGGTRLLSVLRGTRHAAAPRPSAYRCAAGVVLVGWGRGTRSSMLASWKEGRM